MKIDTIGKTLVRDFRARPTIRAGSLITTVFGDSLAPRGGGLWLGSLITIMAEFGVNERLVRTSVYRLANDGWLESTQYGRKAYYSLTADGKERFRAATHRIYGAPAVSWGGDWSVLLLTNLGAEARELVRKECGWLGFGAFSTNVLAHPSPNIEDLHDTLNRLGVSDSVVVMTGQTVHGDVAMRQLAHQSWKLDEIDKKYAAFVRRFAPVQNAASVATSITAKTAFQIRTLLIQDYRAVLLRDPQMPAELLPDNWHGLAAYRLCRDLYRLVHRQADEYLTTIIETEHGALPPPDGDYFARFGGLAVR